MLFGSTNQFCCGRDVFDPKVTSVIMRPVTSIFLFDFTAINYEWKPIFPSFLCLGVLLNLSIWTDFDRVQAIQNVGTYRYQHPQWWPSRHVRLGPGWHEWHDGVIADAKRADQEPRVWRLQNRRRSAHVDGPHSRHQQTAMAVLSANLDHAIRIWYVSVTSSTEMYVIQSRTLHCSCTMVPR